MYNTKKLYKYVKKGFVEKKMGRSNNITNLLKVVSRGNFRNQLFLLDSHSIRREWHKMPMLVKAVPLMSEHSLHREITT